MFSSHQIIIALFPRLLGVIYLFMFLPLLFQMKALVGKEGILPIEPLLQRYQKLLGLKRFYWIPSVFWAGASDKALMAVPAIGSILACLLIAGFHPCILLPILILLHISIITAGQDFLSFGWEMFFSGAPTMAEVPETATVYPNPSPATCRTLSTRRPASIRLAVSANT